MSVGAEAQSISPSCPAVCLGRPAVGLFRLVPGLDLGLGRARLAHKDEQRGSLGLGRPAVKSVG